MDIIESVMKGESIGEKTKLATEAGKVKKKTKCENSRIWSQQLSSSSLPTFDK